MSVGGIKCSGGWGGCEGGGGIGVVGIHGGGGGGIGVVGIHGVNVAVDWNIKIYMR